MQFSDCWTLNLGRRYEAPKKCNSRYHLKWPNVIFVYLRLDSFQKKPYHTRSLTVTQAIDTKKQPSLAFFDFRCRQHFYQKIFEVGLFFGTSYRHQTLLLVYNNRRQIKPTRSIRSIRTWICVLKTRIQKTNTISHQLEGHTRQCWECWRFWLWWKWDTRLY